MVSDTGFHPVTCALRNVSGFSLNPPRRPTRPRPLPRQNSLSQGVEQRLRQHSIGIGPCLPGDRPQIVPWPDKAVEFVQAQPVVACVEAKVTAGRRRDRD